MDTIEIKTLVDITNTKRARLSAGEEIAHNQFKNWTTLLQCIGLRSIINYESDPVVEEVDVKDLGFGKEFKGKHKVWTFRFTTDRLNVYLQDNNQVGLLEQDLDDVPVCGNLTETINISKTVFSTSNSKYKNITIKAI